VRKLLWASFFLIVRVSQGFAAPVEHTSYESQDVTPAHSEAGVPKGLYPYKSPEAPQEPIEGTHGDQTLFPVQGKRGPSYGEEGESIGQKFQEQEKMLQDQGHVDVEKREEAEMHERDEERTEN
jgi:hypothetical protein